MKIAVAGTGYVGLVTGVCLAEHGHFVSCVDMNEDKIQLLKSGKSPIYEPGLEELMVKNMDKIKFTTNYKKAYKDADVIFIGVGTPEKADGSADLQYLYSVAVQIAESVEKDCIVVVKSTVPIGTNERLEYIIKNNLMNDVVIHVASNPEFLSQGSAVRDTLHSSRIIIGAEEESVADILKEVYKDFGAPILVTRRRSAEMIKYASNDFLALKISYINEIANLCEIVGADIDDVAKGMGYDSRIGNKFLNSGIGYGGSCFPKDTKALHWLANFHDYELKTIKAAIDVNENQKIKLIKKSRKYFESLNDVTIAVLGLTFKPGTDDLREAPSLVNIPIMLDAGANVRVWDPVAFDRFKEMYPNEITYCATIEDALLGADICFIFTEWEEIKDFEISKYGDLMKNPIIIDGRNCYELDIIKKDNVIYDSIGRETINNLKYSMS
ncbi:UDP-glucose/GDP-mannose dehydrogenase family protein [Bacillus thuringiensis]|uniref:UDP-glucose 6-dehydrogenase n=1 Tax=Bacillus thuringiensis TaxID=1428 RepID=A0A9X6Z237_BACTU|nr:MULTISPECIES: UDP-glucose/GDP-mannose dehydrogenase family protein [Bacillus]MCT6901789.1 UDP-glucose/GDP-mannose dehydrogenase family protein [Lactobacillus sp.]AJQ61992.1 UDP-glucose 6-dehydrogenase [Bacillus thuringiensis serovar morrisoni]AMR87734.1 UDP-glucose 6-dehydrogenase [Bacillus thuringiensis]KAA0830124.1 UDP-glucose/GDP-mannose dehydrogenase family protein [Bacillus sp. AY2-1]KIP26386.1 nucleotide sugar dehydrogenase family protein [Bacillus thuringiensis serovar morrisoni]